MNEYRFVFVKKKYVEDQEWTSTNIIIHNTPPSMSLKDMPH